MANQFITVEPYLAFHYRAQNQYLENFTEFQQYLLLKNLLFFFPIRLLSLCLLLYTHYWASRETLVFEIPSCQITVSHAANFRWDVSPQSHFSRQ
jgi:hypothetical protein